MSSINVSLPDSVLALIQTGLIERAFHDALFPALLFRQEATMEEWQGNIGTQIFESRAGLIGQNTTPITAGTDPTPKTVPYEQWQAAIQRYADSIDIHMPTAAVANSDLFVRSIQQLGLQAGQSVDSLARDAMFQSYLSGQTVSTVATASTDTQIQVAAVNGFVDVVAPNVRPTPVSASNPLSITIGTGASAVVKQVVGFTLANPNDPVGPGTLLLSSTVGAIFAVRTPVVSSVAPNLIRSGGGSSVDAIGSSDTLVLQDVFNAVASLRRNNVRPHPDGLYHAHLSADANAAMFADPVWQRLFTARPDSDAYQEGFIGAIGGVAFYLNTRSPDYSNAGTLSASGSDPNAQYAPELGAEVVNSGGVRINRTLVTGQGAVYEKRLDEMKFISEAGVTGKIGEFSVVNNGLAISTEGIRLYLRAPLDRLGDLVSATWSISTCFPIPSDITALGTTQRFRRAVVIESAL
jgi:hypothetical protein